MDAKVFEVVSVSLALTKSQPPGLIIHAVGSVSSSGWGNARLVPYVYIAPPADGIWDFDFIATAPNGIALTVISPISATETIYPKPSWCTGVRVHAGSNAMTNGETMLEPATVKTFNWVPFPLGRNAVELMNEGEGTDGVDCFPWIASR